MAGTRDGEMFQPQGPRTRAGEHASRSAGLTGTRTSLIVRVMLPVPARLVLESLFFSSLPPSQQRSGATQVL